MQFRIACLAVLVSALATSFILPTPSIAQNRAACAPGCKGEQGKGACMSDSRLVLCGGTIVLAQSQDDCIASCENIYGTQGARARECVRQCRNPRPRR
jgi:hypothetical protein